ncbi:MAG: NAD(P)H-dependent oxidoreductase [Variibacter sp.]|nr:NAD(P)H-dependent oxidoreductase [Variibacter sp.]
MPKRITIIDGHPDPDPARFCHALARAYAEAAEAAGHQVKRLTLAEIDVPFLRSKAAWEHGEPTPAIRACQEAIAFAEHLVIVYPLWLGDMPALLKAFFEQIGRPGFAIAAGERTLSPGLLKGRSARIVVTMGMPAFIYRWYFFAHSLKSLERNILKFCGIGPIREDVIGLVEGSAKRRARWLARMATLGTAGG